MLLRRKPKQTEFKCLGEAQHPNHRYSPWGGCSLFLSSSGDAQGSYPLLGLPPLSSPSPSPRPRTRTFSSTRIQHHLSLPQVDHLPPVNTSVPAGFLPFFTEQLHLEDSEQCNHQAIAVLHRATRRFPAFPQWSWKASCISPRSQITVMLSSSTKRHSR